MIIEAHAIDDGPVPGQAEQTGLRIAGLRTRRHAADLDEAEALAEHGVGYLAILIEAGGETDRIGKIEPPMAAREARILDRRPARHQSGLEQTESHPVRRFGRKQPQQRQSDAIENDQAAFWIPRVLQTSTSASTSRSIIASSWSGVGVMRRRSVPFGTVG